MKLPHPFPAALEAERMGQKGGRSERYHPYQRGKSVSFQSGNKTGGKQKAAQPMMAPEERSASRAHVAHKGLTSMSDEGRLLKLASRSVEMSLRRVEWLTEELRAEYLSLVRMVKQCDETE